ncbi:hypothetical protein MKX01_040997 [Papaver californicum]|nr:hypothetical protein MKX01_040997 [Papaver californicum]
MESYFFMSIHSLSFLLCLTMFVGKSSGLTVPATYLFGDSLLDTQFLGLPYPPAYLSLSEARRRLTTTGFNYASGGSGILRETGTILGDVLTLDEQIDYFNSTVTNDLHRIYSIPTILSATLSRSIFVISTDSNDYLNNYLFSFFSSNTIYKPSSPILSTNPVLQYYLQTQFSNTSQTYPPQEFANLLLDTFEQQLTVLLIYRRQLSCVEAINNLINIYNNGLPAMLQRLSSSLQGSTFVRADLFAFGYANGRTPCCNFDASGKCIPGQAPRSDRDNRLYFDAIHPVQQVNNQFSRECFYDNTTLCTPINIKQLALK